MKILCIGHCVYDISLPFDDFPEENKKYRIENREESGGGPACNAAYLLGKWGMDVSMAGMVGNDEYGKKIIEELQEVNVKTDYIETSYEHKTSTSFIIVNTKNGSRTLINLPMPYTPLKKCELDFSPEIILIDGHDYLTSKRIINKYEKAITVLDAGRYREEIIEICKSVKYLVASKEFAEEATKIKCDFNNKSSLAEIYQNMKNKFPKPEIIITLEENGVLYCENNNIKLLPGMDIVEKDTTGAGDIFHGAFVYALANNYELEKALKYANITAGISCTRFNPRKSIPTLDEVIVEYEKL